MTDQPDQKVIASASKIQDEAMVELKRVGEVVRNSKPKTYERVIANRELTEATHVYANASHNLDRAYAGLPMLVWDKNHDIRG